MKIERIEEFKISNEVHEKIADLLKNCFSEYPGNRDYYKQIPTFRYLIWHKKHLIGHMGVEHRMIKIGEVVASIFGVSDICILKAYQSQKMGSALLQKLDKLARSNDIDFLILIASKFKLYEDNGFQLVKNTCRWLMINDHQTLGVNHKNIKSCLMVKEIGEKRWNGGLMDFLGAIF